MRFELPGASLRLHALLERDAASVQAQLDPYSPIPDRGDEPADVEIVGTDVPPPPFVDIQNPANDARVTASDGSRLYLVGNGTALSLPRFDRGTPYRFEFPRGFPVQVLMRSVLRPALQVAMLERDVVAVHGTAVEYEGRAVVVAGWSESGKTETALAFLERGARFISDKWTAVTNTRDVSPFPISAGIRRWVLPFLPRLRRQLPRGARVQLTAAAAASFLTRPLQSERLPSSVGAAARAATHQVLALADRAALTPSQLSRAYGADRPVERAPLRAVVFLTTVPDGVTAQEASAETVARRLARSAAYERRAFFDLLRRMRFSVGDVRVGFEADVERREEEALTGRLETVQVLDVRAPFPTDPRRVADAIARCL